MPLSVPTLDTARATFDNARQWITRPRPLIQAQTTPFQVIHDDGLARLRYYPPLTETAIPLEDGSELVVSTQRQRTPLVLVPPLAVNMLIYDLFPQRSLVRYLRARGFELYLIDWGRPGRAHDRQGLAHYFAERLPGMLERVREHSGERRLNLHGWSFGGLFNLCYCALGRDPDIGNLVLVGAPTDYHRNGILGRQYQRISHTLGWLRRRTGWRAHELSPGWFRSPGWLNSLAFKLTSPVASLKGYLDLLRHLHDHDYVSNHATNGAFLDDMVAYPGAVMQDIIHYLWVDNVMAEGRLPMEGDDGNLSRVTVPMLNITSPADMIVTPECSRAMLPLVSSTDVECLSVSGGHMAILGGGKAQQESWPRVAQWLIERDG